MASGSMDRLVAFSCSLRFFCSTGQRGQPLGVPGWLEAGGTAHEVYKSRSFPG